MAVAVKICGVRDPVMAQVAIDAGANSIGVVFYPRSPRFVTNEQARKVSVQIRLSRGERPTGEAGRVRGLAAARKALHPNPIPIPLGEGKFIGIIGLFVDPADAELEEITKAVPLDMLQLHGSETPERVAEIRSRFDLPVMKALGIGSAADLVAVAAYEDAADWLLFDARPPSNAVLPGGNGVPFDWALLAERTWKRPWMLSGGLTPDNVAEAIRITGVTAVDVSSGVESGPGVKNAALVRDFIAATLPS